MERYSHDVTNTPPWFGDYLPSKDVLTCRLEVAKVRKYNLHTKVTSTTYSCVSNEGVYDTNEDEPKDIVLLTKQFEKYLKNRKSFKKKSEKKLNSESKLNNCNESMSSINCYECGGQGHIAKNYANRKNIVSNNNRAMKSTWDDESKSTNNHHVMVSSSQKSEDLNGQVNTFLSSLDIDGDMNSKGHLLSRVRELDGYWNESQAMQRPGAHATDGWVTQFNQHRVDCGDLNAWAHSIEQQHGANGWSSEFEQQHSQMMSGDHMRGGQMARLAAMEHLRRLANTLAQNEDPKFQKSRFLQFVSKMSRGELIIDDNQVKQATPSTAGDWAGEYQQLYNAGSNWANEYAHGNTELSRANQWANEFGSEQEQHGSVDDQWVNQFSKLHVDDWAEEFGNQVGEGILEDGSADTWANAYDE